MLPMRIMLAIVGASGGKGSESECVPALNCSRPLADDPSRPGSAGLGSEPEELPELSGVRVSRPESSTGVGDRRITPVDDSGRDTRNSGKPGNLHS